MVTGLVEVFEGTQSAGWDCSASNGEGLSRVLATQQYRSGEITRFVTGATWLDSDRPDFVNNTDLTDFNPVSIGCAVLFLNYLHDQLGHGWESIVQAAGTTLRQTYQTLTGNTDDPFPEFAALLQQMFPSRATHRG